MPSRRGRGEGGIRQLASGSWQASLPGRARGGRTKTFPTKPEALEWLRGNAGRTSGATGTLGDWLTDWLALHKADVAATTYDRDRQVVGNIIRPKLGPVRLRDLTGLRIREFLAELAEAGISASERHRAGTTLRKALNAAVGADRLHANPMTVPGKRVKLPKVRRDEARPFTPSELADVLAACHRPVWIRAAVLVAVDCGLRPGELVGLQWGDYDGERLAIRRAVCRKRHELKELKTDRSRRTLPLAMATRAALDALPRLTPDKPLFGSRFGRHYTTANFSRRFLRPLFDRAGLPWAVPYTPRHTCASFLFAAGLNILIVSARLGHSKPTLTLDTYGHLMPNDQDKAAAALGRFFDMPQDVRTG